MSEEVHEDIRLLSENALDCRDYGHSWKHSAHWAPVTDRRRVIAYERAIICDTCGTERRDLIDAHTGERTTLGYHYADGYLAAKGHGRIRVHEVRMEHIRRMLESMKAG